MSERLTNLLLFSGLTAAGVTAAAWKFGPASAAIVAVVGLVFTVLRWRHDEREDRTIAMLNSSPVRPVLRTPPPDAASVGALGPTPRVPVRDVLRIGNCGAVEIIEERSVLIVFPVRSSLPNHEVDSFAEQLAAVAAVIVMNQVAGPNLYADRLVERLSLSSDAVHCIDPVRPIGRRAGVDQGDEVPCFSGPLTIAGSSISKVGEGVLAMTHPSGNLTYIGHQIPLETLAKPNYAQRVVGSLKFEEADGTPLPVRAAGDGWIHLLEVVLLDGGVGPPSDAEADSDFLHNIGVDVFRPPDGPSRAIRRRRATPC